jgi:CMP-N,N'-diacetyllegionaminic acid synthase
LKPLFIIPARGGSKGIPGKNIKELAGKPLIHYSLEFARLFAPDEEICVTTDSRAIADSVLTIRYEVPFLRPSHLATDQAGTFDVLNHALEYYEKMGKRYEAIVLLQPTSPFRKSHHFEEAWKLFEQSSVDMVVSVKASSANPYFNLFEEGKDGLLHISKGDGRILRRQEAPVTYEFNGSIYIISSASLKQKKSMSAFDRIVKYVMSEEFSIDLDTPADWSYAEFMCKQPLMQ